ncbi:ABC transporter substrate-binding protein [Roseomonas sp. NAR14]|uniref:ABC transporter substrate-binding protein n=1 Tax=Roseomonas acroporae TaxID=2937791 RepID=A0A9X1Y4H4_9PROT|nr:ABC transporter substrate-binding protein [Roseomonas acroporae]MCK8783789.1 ABC transporter substrate-binding protein [Roseomonas acroporae]
MPMPRPFGRRRLGGLALGLTAGAATGAPPALAAEKVVRVGMTAGDIPRTHGQPDQAFEGVRVAALTLYDALTVWDYDTGTTLRPCLATDWRVDEADRTKWVFRLRPGIRFHDGAAFDAEAVVWNVRKVLDRDAPHFDPSQVGQTVSRMPTLRSARAIDALTVELATAEPDAFLPLNLSNLFFASPAHWQAKLAAVPATVTEPAQRAAQAWEAFARDPSGTGAWRLAVLVPRQRLELVRNPDYWDRDRVPKLDRLVFLPLIDHSARAAALLSGQVDWIEAPAPDVIDSMKARGFRIVTSRMAHVWPWQPSLLEGSPWRDKRVRQAANLCVDRGDLVVLNGGLAEPAAGQVRRDHPWFGNPGFRLRHDPAEARRLMEAAGYSAQRRAAVTVLVTPGGSGQMQSLPMNEYLQQAMGQCHFDVKLEVLEWGTLFTNWREGPRAPAARGANATNVSIATIDPFFAIARFADSRMAPPVSNNWGFVNDPELDRLTAAARLAFGPGALDQAVARIHERLVDEAMMLWFVHDVSPRALGPRLAGYRAPNGFFVDWSSLDIAA